MCDVEWSVSSHRQTHGSSNGCGARCNGFPNRRRPRDRISARTAFICVTFAVTSPQERIFFSRRNTTPVRLSTEGLVFIKKWEPIGALSLLFRYGENSGDSTHAEPHFRTSCHYQILS